MHGAPRRLDCCVDVCLSEWNLAAETYVPSRSLSPTRVLCLSCKTPSGPQTRPQQTHGGPDAHDAAAAAPGGPPRCPPCPEQRRHGQHDQHDEQQHPRCGPPLLLQASIGASMELSGFDRSIDSDTMRRLCCHPLDARSIDPRHSSDALPDMRMMQALDRLVCKKGGAGSSPDAKVSPAGTHGQADWLAGYCRAHTHTHTTPPRRAAPPRATPFALFLIS